jgi:hypothetical protein
VKTNPVEGPESGRANGGTIQDTNSNKSTAPATQKGATQMFGATAGMPRRFKGNFDFQFVRTMGCTTYDGAQIGERYETASRIEDEKEDSYTEAWRVTAERVEAIARESSCKPILVSPSHLPIVGAFCYSGHMYLGSQRNGSTSQKLTFHLFAIHLCSPELIYA